MIRAYRAIFSLSYLVILVLTACAPVTAAQTATPVPTLAPAGATTESVSPLAQYFVPPYYAPEYIDIVEGSKLEDGLIIYSTLAAANWSPIIEVFNSHYPWIKVTSQDPGTDDIFTRYNDDISAATRTADMVISSDQIGWQTFLIKKQALTYRSQEDLFVPEWSKPTIGISKTHSGLYTLSSDPMIIIYNKNLLPAAPDSISAIATSIKSDADFYKNQIVTYDAELSSTGFAANMAWTNRTGETGWANLSVIGRSSPHLETSDTEMVDAVGKGQAKLGYFISSSAVYPKLGYYPDLGWTYIADGQPILLRNMAITQNAASPNSAKLMLDFILSQDGQLALEKGGLTPYRNDIFGVTEHHLNLIAQKIGDANIILSAMDDRLMDEAKRQLFIDLWKNTLLKPITP